MKKIISIVLALLFVCAGFVSCGDKVNHEDFLTANYNYDLSEYIDLGNYTGLYAMTEPYSVDEEFYISIQVQSSLTYYGRNVEVDRASRAGDTLYINSISTINGVPFEGGTTSGYAITLGSGVIGLEFENNLIGYSAGALVSFDISVPDEDTELDELRGKTIHYEVEIISVCEKELPEYTDAFVKAYLGYDSIEDYEANIVKSLKENYKEGYYTDVVPQVWEVVAINTDVIKYPEKELKEKYENLVAGVQDYANVKGLTLAQCVRALFDMTEDEFYAYAQDEAEADVKEEMMCYAIARAENLVLTDEEYEKRALTIATDVYGLESVAQLEEKYDIKTIKKGILMDMVKEIVADLASVEYTDPGEIYVNGDPTGSGVEHDHEAKGETEN